MANEPGTGSILQLKEPEMMEVWAVAPSPAAQADALPAGTEQAAALESAKFPKNYWARVGEG